MQPNIIFILIDDLGWRDLGCYGSSFYETPHLDQLATEGMLFTDAYAACPVCSPTRASIMTGKYPATLGITDWIDWANAIHPARGKLVDVPYLKELPLSETTVATLLRNGGYATWHVGKWHLGDVGHHPEDHGFDRNIGGCRLGSPAPGGYFSPYAVPGLEGGADGEYLTDRLTDEAIRLIEQRDPAQPFFLNFWHYAVHTPIQAKEADIAKYQAKAQRLGLDQLPTFCEGDFYPTEHKQHLRIRRRLLQSDPVYAAMVENLDWNIGRLLEALERNGIAKETVVIFTSDNGGLSTSEGSPTCNAPLAEGKGWMYEGGTREPLIIRWPGVITGGSRCTIPVTSPDFLPTLLTMAEIPIAEELALEGVDFSPLLRGAATLDRDAIFWHYPHYGNQGGTPGSSVRAGDYKLIEFFEDGRLELYNLRTDVQEEDNLVGQEGALTQQLHQMLQAWRVAVEAQIPQPNPTYSLDSDAG
ncbi:MAG TPA: sulfatase [Caldilineaceae bacterium]|nr:sulfatase [Caldilineaceae bacterium]